MQSLPRHIRMRSVAGFSLVELMVAIAISLLLLAGVVAIFSSSRVSYESTDQLSRVQETGRFALEAISRQVRSAGFGGCSRQPNYVSTALNSTSTLQWNFLAGPVRGYNASGSAWTPTLDASITGAAAGSDVLVLRGPRTDAQPAIVTTNMASPTDPLVISGGSIAVNDIVMAYSCEGQAFFQVTAAGGTLSHAAVGAAPGNATGSTSYQFKRNAEVVTVETTVYFVGPSVGATAPGNTLPIGTNSLYRQVGSSAREELVQGVEQMQVEYGIDTNNDRTVDSYSAATATTNWQQVISVRVALLVRSIQQYGTDVDARSYVMSADTTVPAANDRRTRQLFTATISLRNRVRVD